MKFGFCVNRDDFSHLKTNLILAFSVVLVLAASVSGLINDADAQQRVTPRTQQEMFFSYAPIVKRVGPAVVNVFASRKAHRQQGVAPFFNDPFFQRFFGGPNRQPNNRQQSSLGSGVIISPDGLIVTNHHVVQGADEVKVVLSNKKEYESDIILKDERTDLAILQVRSPGADFPFVEFSDSDALEVGDIVLAIGNPFGVGQTVTQGIVSALARTQVGVSDYQFFIQTDAAINPGNSGGALIDMNGRLVGINTAIFSRSGGSNGIGFAIPANMVRSVATSAQRGGDKVVRPWLGARLQAVDADLAASVGLDRPRGAMINGISKNSPAARAGLRVGDIILRLDGARIEDPNGFNYRFATKGVSGNAGLRILRDGRLRRIDVALKKRPKQRRQTIEVGGKSPISGAKVSLLTAEIADDMRIRWADSGLVITDIKRGSKAQRFNFRPGDIVLEINGRKLKSLGDIRLASKGNAFFWRFVVNRGGRLISLAFSG